LMDADGHGTEGKLILACNCTVTTRVHLRQSPMIELYELVSLTGKFTTCTCYFKLLA